MFSTKTAAISNEEFSNSSYMPVGINQNVTLKEVNCNKSPQGLDFLEIVFENEDGQTATMTEWKNTKGMYIKTDEDLQKRDNAQFGRVCQILDCFYPQRPDAELSTFKEMIDWTKQMLDPMIATKKKLRLKVIYDKKGYTQVSKLGIFVEDMSNTDSQIKLFKKTTIRLTCHQLLLRKLRMQQAHQIFPFNGFTPEEIEILLDCMKSGKLFLYCLHSRSAKLYDKWIHPREIILP